MPNYTFKCNACGSKFDELILKKYQNVECTKCKSIDVVKVFSSNTNTALIFKGSGFYVNDYKK